MSIFFRIFVIGLMLISSSIYAADPLVISSGTSEATPIAVVPFGWSGGSVLPEDMAKVISKDLYNSGVFKPIPQSNMISQPAKANEIVYRDWDALNAQYVLIGNIVQQGEQLQAQYSLFNVATKQLVISRTVTGTEKQLRDMAHNAADQVFETLTGVPGAFSTRLLYVTANRLSVNNTNYTLNRSDYDGHRSATLLTSKEPILSPSFSPDGHHVSYVSFEKRKPRIFLQDISNGKREQLTDFPGLNGAPAWSPDGKKLAFVLSKDGNPEIYVMTLATHSLQRVTNQYAIDTEPFWGKDNQTIYFTSDRSGKPQIYKTQLGGSVNRVTFVGNYNAKPTLSADEKTLVMIHRQEGYTVFNVAAQDLKTGRIHLLSNSKLDESPTIAPNGTMLVYATHQNGKSVLILASINGRVKFTLPTVQGDMREPSWSPYLK